MVSAWLIVTAPFLANALPFKVPPLSVMFVVARIFPAKTLFVSMVADETTCQNTLFAEAPLVNNKVKFGPVVRELGIWKSHFALGSPPPSRVKVPVKTTGNENV